MGTWGTGTFENDIALDWIGCLRDGQSTGHVIAALRAVADTHTSEYVDSILANEALAAAEVVASAMERPDSWLPDLAAEWVTQFQPSFDRATVAMAVKAVRRVMVHSETQQLWDETKYAAEWRWTVSCLLGRLETILARQPGI
jgi:hypothetical protein